MPERPNFHFTPAKGWINDPNGLIYHHGEYHLFYQHHPSSTVWGPMHWGHAVSRDLLAWQELPIALAPDDIGTIFSGSAVVDRANTAGFGANAMVAVFTHDAGKSVPHQMQSLAYSLDNGRNWKKYSGNPVLKPPTGIHDFRDPKVFWFESRSQSHWVMALAVGREIWFYRSTNLKDWTESSRFGASHGSHAGVWECPELVELPVQGSLEKRWVLFVSVNAGAPAGGSGVQYFVGAFDGRIFVAQDAISVVRWVDHGADFYAPQAWNDAPGGRKLWLAWMNNWSYANQIPDTGGWRGSMSVVRELALMRDGRAFVLTQTPAHTIDATRPALASLRARMLASESLPVSGLSRPPAHGHKIEVAFNLVTENGADNLGLTLSNAAGTCVVLCYSPAQQKLSINRGAAGPSLVTFVLPHHASLAPRDGRIALRIFLDATSIELFADDGRCVMTEQIFADAPLTTLSAFANGGSVEVERLDVFAWP